MTTAQVNLILEANAALIERADTQHVESYFSPRYVVHVGGAQRRGHSSVRGFVDALGKAFSDLSVSVDVLVEAEDTVCWQRTIRGRHAGAFQGFPASGRTIEWRDMVVSRFEQGVIAEEWAVTDLAETLLRARDGHDAD